MSRFLRTWLPSLLFITGCVLPGDFGEFSSAPSKDGGGSLTNGGDASGNMGRPDGSTPASDGGNAGGMDGGNTTTGDMDAGMDSGSQVDLLCMMAGCDPAATCDSSSGQAVCACAEGYLDFGVIDPDNPQPPGRVCFDFNECEDQTATCPSFSTCRNTPGAYACDCDTGYVKVGEQCLDGCTVLYTANKCSKATATCSKPEGAAVCACKFGYKDTSVKQDGSLCVIDDTCTGLVCDERALCVDTDAGMPECACPAGYAGDGSVCDDVNECDEDTFECDDDADCVNTQGGYACDCRDGFTGDGKICDDVDECTQGTANCDPNATCSNSPAGSFTCACKGGYAGNGKTCSDVDECTLGTDNCSPNADCANTTGAFACTCKAGYSGNGVTCNDIDECATNNGGCGAGVLCSNSPGSFSCGCPQGERKVNNVCTNINECAEELDNCSPNATCTDDATTGAPYFTCACTSGYSGDGVSCVDINECLTNNGGCGPFRTCSNNAGAAPTCTDINECLTNNGGCGSSTYYTCTNNINAAPTCTDINECASNNGGCGSATFYTCTNNAGGPPTCADINECLTNNGGCGNATFYSCTNNAGAAPTCADINECATNNGGCGSATFYSCTNNAGAAPTCADINECATNNGGCGNATYWTCTNNNGAAPTCTDKNECAVNNGNCGSPTYWTCTNNTGAAQTCTDINECNTNNGGCGSALLYTCTNNAGAAPTCSDLNECLINNGGCGSATYWICTNNNGAAPTCTDRNECATNNGNCGAASAWTCTNNTGAAPTCTDINECNANTDGCDSSPDACVNSTGSFSCTCPNGYSGNGVGAGGCLRNECTLNLSNCDDIAICTDTQEAFSCSCGPGYTGTGVGPTGCCTPDGARTDSTHPNDGIDNDCNGLKDKPIITYASSFPELGGAASGADVSIAVAAASNVTATTKQLQYRKYKRTPAGTASGTFANCAANPCKPFSNTEAQLEANNGAWRIELRWAFGVAAGTFYSETESFDVYTHHSLYGAAKCPSLGVTDAALFAAAATDLAATLVGETAAGYKMVDPGAFAIGTETFLTNPFVTVGYRPVTGASFTIKYALIALTQPTANSTPAYSADMWSLRKRFVASSDNRYILIRRAYASLRTGRCEAANFRIASSDRIYKGVVPRPSSQAFFTARCDAVVLNRAGAGVCLDVNNGGITQLYGQSTALNTDVPPFMAPRTLGYGDSDKFMWRQLLEERDYNGLFQGPVTPTHTIFRNFTAKCDTQGCNSGADDRYELYLPDKAVMRP